MKLKILSWNIWCDGHFSEISNFLTACNADIIGLQEVLPHSKQIPVINLMTKLGYYHVYFPVMEMVLENGETEELGNAIFSKYPIIESRVHVLSQQHKRIAVQADIDVSGTLLHIFCTHLKHTHHKPSELQDSQARSLVKVLPHNHVIVMGDFNATPDSMPIKIVEVVLSNTDTSFKPTWSVYPEGCSVCKPQSMHDRLDYIFISSDIKAVSSQVENSKGSDHLPISVMIQI